MAEEVGAAFVSILPSARGLTQKIKRELQKALRGIRDEQVSVPVKPEIDPVSGTLRSELQRQMRDLAKRIGLELPVDADTDGLRPRLETQLEQVREALSIQVPTEPGEQADYQRKLRQLIESTRVTQKVQVEQDLDTRSVRRSIAESAVSSGTTAGRLFTAGFGSTLLNPLIGIPAVILGAIGAAVLAPVIAGAIVAGGGLAAILVGAFALRADAELKTAVTGLGQTISTTLAEAAAPLKGPFLEAIGIVGQAIKDLGPDLKDFFTEIAPTIPRIAQGFSEFLKQLRETGALDKFATAIVPVLDQLAMALPDLGNALAQFLISMSEIGPEGAAAFGTALRIVADLIRFTGDALVWLTQRSEDLGEIALWLGERLGDILPIVQPFGTILFAIASLFDGLTKALIDFANSVAEKWSGLWGGMASATSNAATNVVATARAIPGMIVSAVGNLGSLLLNAGRNVIQGLIDGIRSKFGALANASRDAAATVRNFLPFSPAKEGPLSGSGSPFRSGQAIAGDLAAGVQSQLPTVASAADHLAGSFGLGPAAGMAAVGTPRIVIDATGLPDGLAEWLRHSVRVFGVDGSVESAYGQ